MTNCNCEGHEHFDPPVPPFWGFSAFTPTIPKLYWDVKSQEQRILNLFDLLDKLICYTQSIGGDVNGITADLQKVKDELQRLEDGGLEDLYERLIVQWVQDNLLKLWQAFVLGVSFGLTDDGHFCAYVPESWSDVIFDTGMAYGRSDYGRLILRMDVDGKGVIDNSYRGFLGNADAEDVRTDLELAMNTLFTDLDDLTMGGE